MNFFVGGDVEPLELAYKANGGHKVDMFLAKEYFSLVFDGVSKMSSVKLIKHDL